MNIDTESTIRQGRIVMLLELIKDRELASSAGQYDALTVSMLALLLQISNPYEAGRRKPGPPPLTLLMQKLADDIAAGEFLHPFKFDTEDGSNVLCVRLSNVMQHLTRSTWMLERWDTMPIKTSCLLRRQLKTAGALLLDVSGMPLMFERTLGGKREAHLYAISLSALAAIGVDASTINTSMFKPQP